MGTFVCDCRETTSAPVTLLQSPRALLAPGLVLKFGRRSDRALPLAAGVVLELSRRGELQLGPR